MRAARSAEWHLIEPPHIVYLDDEVEVHVSASCRMQIDMAPDRLQPVRGIAWSEMSFGPKAWFETRHKVAYYCARTVEQLTTVEFYATGTCDCKGCPSEHLVAFQLQFAPVASESDEPEGSDEPE